MVAPALAAPYHDAATLPPLSDRLRIHTRDAHHAVEQAPIAGRITSGALTLSQYAAWLLAWDGILDALDDAAHHAHHPVVTAFVALAPCRRHTLAQDREVLATRGVRTEQAAVAGQHAALAQLWQLEAVRRPASLIGARYVVEGASLGGLVLARAVQQTLGADVDGATTWLQGRGAASMAHWRQVRALLDTVADPHEQAVVLAGAQAAFAGVGSVLGAIEI